MGKFKSMVDTPERLAKFRRKYNFLDDVEVRYFSEDKVIHSRGMGRVVLPLVAILEGGVRIPISDLLTHFLRHFKVFPDQCTPNIFRVISSIDTLNKRLGLNLTKHDINYVYCFQDSKTSGYYFKTRHGEVRLISGLPDTDKETERDYLVISGNWCCSRTHCPTNVGKAEGPTLKKKRQTINSIDLNRLLRSPIYPHADGTL